MTTPEHALVPAGDATLLRTWTRPVGIIGWLSASDHKTTGVRFIVTAIGFFVLGGLEALALRIQLAKPQLAVLDPDMYNQIFTMHGTTMMFFFGVPVIEGIALYLVPLMIGSRETAFPRLTAFSYWIYLFAGIALYWGFLTGTAPDAGWFSYPTLTLREHSPSLGVDYWALSITLLEFSALSVAVVLIVTIFKHRAPGMTLTRMPVFVWSILVFAFMVAFAMPTLVLASILLELDRQAGTHFFRPGEGGDPVLWQHLFWWFGHPEVYIMFIPAVGIIASILPSFTRRPVVGYHFVVLSLVATGFLSFLVWAHHMFATGLPRVALGFFSAATFVVAIPSGVQIFAWLATVWSSRRLVFATPFLYSIGFVVTFVFGGISGVTLAAVPWDRQVTDTFYVVGHFHYVLVGGMVLPLIAGLFYWYPKVTGRLMSEQLGKASFWCVFIGLNLTFFPMHFSGMWGMPRRVYTYHDGLGLTIPNLISTIGAITMGLGVLLILWNVVRSRRTGVLAGPDPWGGDTLEWAMSSPPPAYNFRVIPTVRSRSPMRAQVELASHDEPLWEETPVEERLAIELRDDRRETPITRAVDAVVDGRNIVAGPSIWPFLAAISAAVAIIGILIHPWALGIGAILSFITMAAWHWPEERGGPVAQYGGIPIVSRETGERPVDRVVPASETSVCHTNAQAPLYWAMILFIVIEAVFFAAIIAAYFFLRGNEVQWPPGKTQPPELMVPIIYTVVLLLSSVAMFIGDSAIKENKKKRLVIAQVTALSLAMLFLALKGYEYSQLVTYKWYSHAYGSLTWTISTFHASHVFSVVLKGSVVLALALKGYFNSERRLGVQINGVYWHFVVLIWLPLFFTLYVAPYLI